MVDYKPYKICKSLPYNFYVNYEFLLDDDGNYIQKPFIGMRSDFSYAGHDDNDTNYYLIHPEFIDDDENVITESDLISKAGKATMWVMVPEMVDLVHKERAKPDVVGFMMRGGTRIAQVVITAVNW